MGRPNLRVGGSRELGGVFQQVLQNLKRVMAAIRKDEFQISRAVLGAPEGIPGLRLNDQSDAHRLAERVPTFSFTLTGWRPCHLAD